MSNCHPKSLPNFPYSDKLCLVHIRNKSTLRTYRTVTKCVRRGITLHCPSLSDYQECISYISLQWRHNEHDGVSNHRRVHCLLNCWFWRRTKKTSKLRVIDLCGGNSPVTGDRWRHHVQVIWQCPLKTQTICRGCSSQNRQRNVDVELYLMWNDTVNIHLTPVFLCHSLWYHRCFTGTQRTHDVKIVIMTTLWQPINVMLLDTCMKLRTRRLSKTIFWPNESYEA